MRAYLATLHRRPPHHRKQFAFLVSASFTLLLFTLWSIVKFGGPNVEVADSQRSNVLPATEVTPVEMLRANASESWSALLEQLEKAKIGLDSLNIESEQYGR